MFDSLVDQLTGWKPLETGLIAKPQSEAAYFYESFVVSETDLREMARLMQEEVQSVSGDKEVVFSIKAVAHQVGVLEIETVEELLKYSNTWKKRLNWVSFLATVEDGTAGTRVILHDFGPGWSVAVLAEGGNYEWALGAKKKLVNVVEGTLQWYSRLSTNRFWTWFAFVLIVIWAVVTIYSITQMTCFEAPFLGAVETRTSTGEVIDSRPATVKDITSDESLVIEFLVSFVSPPLIIVLLFVVRPILFPKGLFLIGKGKTRDAILKKWRWGVLAGLVFPILVGLTLKLL